MSCFVRNASQVSLLWPILPCIEFVVVTTKRNVSNSYMTTLQRQTVRDFWLVEMTFDKMEIAERGLRDDLAKRIRVLHLGYWLAYEDKICISHDLSSNQFSLPPKLVCLSGSGSYVIPVLLLSLALCEYKSHNTLQTWRLSQPYAQPLPSGYLPRLVFGNLSEC